MLLRGCEIRQLGFIAAANDDAWMPDAGYRMPNAELQ